MILLLHVVHNFPDGSINSVTCQVSFTQITCFILLVAFASVTYVRREKHEFVKLSLITQNYQTINTI